MDTSETYIKMRVRAIPDLGMGAEDMALTSPYFVTETVWIAPNANYYCSFNIGGKKDVVVGCQLERQDQLQEMLSFKVGTFKDNFWTSLSILHEWAFAEKFVDYIPQSMEQLWLAFVMREKYNKVWSGEDWL